MLAIKFLMKFIRILNRDASPQQIAGGMALGAIAGITPLASLHNLLVLVAVLMLRVNITSAILACGVFSGVAYGLDPLSNRVGYFLLVELDFLKPFWTSLYNMPLVPWTGFNNTLTLGSLILALVLFWPLYLALVWVVVKYREKFMGKVQKWRIVMLLKSSKLYGLYRRFAD